MKTIANIIYGIDACVRGIVADMALCLAYLIDNCDD